MTALVPDDQFTPMKKQFCPRVRAQYTHIPTCGKRRRPRGLSPLTTVRTEDVATRRRQGHGAVVLDLGPGGLIKLE